MIDYPAQRKTMVDTQIRPSDVTKFTVINAMLSVPREEYLPQASRHAAYIGTNVLIHPGRWMLEPRTFAKMLNALDIHKNDVVLDVGCGLGYSSAVIAQMAETVIALEENDALGNEAQSILSSQSVDNTAVLTGPLVEGSAKHGPYDAIIIEGGVEIIPQTLLDQLKEGGKIAAIMMTDEYGTVRIGYKQHGHVTWKSIFDATAPVLAGFEKKLAFAL